MKNNKFIKSLSFFFLSLNIFEILGLTERYYGFSVGWKILSLVVFAIFIYSTNNKMKFSARYLWVLLVYATVELLVVLAGLLDEGYVTFNLKDQVVPLIYISVFLVILGNYKLSIESLKTINLYYIIFLVLACLYNLYLNIDSLTSFLSIDSSYDATFSSFFENRNTFGFFTAFGLMLTFINLSIEKNKKWRNMYMLSVVLFFASLFLTLSRAPFLMLTVFMAFYSFGALGFLNRLKYSILIGLACLLFVQVIGYDFISDNLLRPEAGSSGRDVIFNFGYDFFLQNNVIFGSGYDRPFAALEATLQHSTFHNTYITLLVTGGICKLVVYILSLLLSYAIILKLKRFDKKLGFAFMGILFATTLYGFFESNFIFQASAGNFLTTLYVIFIPLYLVNYLQKHRDISDGRLKEGVLV